MEILVINFSSRQGGNCEAVGNYLKENLKGHVTFKSFGSMEVNPCGKCECQCFNQNSGCPFMGDDIFELYENVTASDLVYFVVPNYSDYPCSNYFVFNERGQGYFTGMDKLYEKYRAVRKRFIVISNTEMGNFIKAFRDQVNYDPDILFLSSRLYGKSSIHGILMEEDKAQKVVSDFIFNEN